MFPPACFRRFFGAVEGEADAAKILAVAERYGMEVVKQPAS